MKLNFKWDWFEKCKYLMMSQGLVFATSIYALWLVLNDDYYRYYAVGYFVIAELYTFIIAKIVNNIRSENENKPLEIKIEKK